MEGRAGRAVYRDNRGRLTTAEGLRQRELNDVQDRHRQLVYRHLKARRIGPYGRAR